MKVCFDFSDAKSNFIFSVLWYGLLYTFVIAEYHAMTAVSFFSVSGEINPRKL